MLSGDAITSILRKHEEALLSILRKHEETLIKQFINNMNEADQKAALVKSLDLNGWTWKAVVQAANPICVEERKKQKADEEARRMAADEEAQRMAADEAAREAQQPGPKASNQRRKRKKKNW